MDDIDVVARARSCLGARFRMHGRDPVHGLDCVGLAAIAFARMALPADYPPRGGTAAAIGATIEAAGLVPVAAMAAGDLVLLDMGAGQWHLAVLTAGGFVHADARLRRVVETPGRPAAPVLGIWRKDG